MPPRAGWHLLLLPTRRSPWLLEILAYTLLQHPVEVVAAGSPLHLYRLAAHLRRHSPQPQALLRRLHLRRAFTIPQLVTLIQEMPAEPTPLAVLGLLAPFTDENLPLQERLSLLRQTLNRLVALAQARPVLLVTTLPEPELAAPLLEAHFRAQAQPRGVAPPPFPSPPRLL